MPTDYTRKNDGFMWLAGEGMMMCGTNGSQLWDIAFITQALVETGLANDEDNKPSLIKALQWLDRCQIRENPEHFEGVKQAPNEGCMAIQHQGARIHG
jgi:lanosterol synthase